MKKIIYLLVGIVLFGGLYYSCVPEELPGSIYGTVVDKATGEPIKSAGVELSPSGLKTVTGSEGQFEFTELAPGKYTLIITKTGYIDGVSGTIEVKPGQQAKGDVQIEKLPPALKVVNDNREEISILDFGSAEDDVARSFSVFNDGTETLEWELTATADWIKSVSKTTGTLSAGATQAIIITIDRAKLSSGENKTTVHITSNSGNKQLVVTATNNFQPTKLNVLSTTDIKSTSATLNGEIVEDGSPIYTERGFVYAETTQPTIDNAIQKITVPITDDKTFSATINDLILGKKYYVRAYAIHNDKDVYSANEVSFTAEGSSLPKVSTKAITDIYRSTGKALIAGAVTELGDPVYSERGFVYGTTHNPIIQNATKVQVEGSGLGEYFTTLSDLQLGNMYYVRAYALNTVGVAYGEEQTVDFNPILPVVVTNDVTGISEETKSATFHATITNAGDPVYTERGFVYGKSPDPTTGGATKVVVAGSGTGTYYGDVHNLEIDCAYYVRAYVTYSSGTVYGDNKVFSVKKMYPPTVTTSAVTNINKTTATASGNVTNDGGINVTERGVVFSTSQNPTVADSKITSGSGTGAFTCNLTGLEEGKKYYVRAYAMNVVGIGYGEQVDFTVITGPQTITVNGVSFKMIAVQGGTFTMGATSEQGTSEPLSDEYPTHSVTLSNYYIGETEVTRELWQAVMGTSSSSSGEKNLPISGVSWEVCQNFIAELNAMTGKKFRLPTEAEWEYAARGGNKSNGFKYSGSSSIDKVAWYYGNSCDDCVHAPIHPVKQKQANELGIYDMSGNVREWCQDWYGSYSSSAQVNPTGPSSGSDRVSRGGCSDYFATHCRVSYRRPSTPSLAKDYFGLRLAL